MIDEPPTRVVLERVLPATPADVFSAWTTADVLEKLMCPGDVTRTHVGVDARVGGRFRIVMRAGGRDTLVTIELVPHEHGTRMLLVHERLPDGAALRSHQDGWTIVAEKLTRHLSTEVSNARSAVR